MFLISCIHDYRNVELSLRTFGVVYLILFLTNRNASHILLHSMPYVSGIAATLVNVRVGLGLAVGERGRTQTWTLQDSFVNGNSMANHTNDLDSEGQA